MLVKRKYSRYQRRGIGIGQEHQRRFHIATLSPEEVLKNEVIIRSLLYLIRKTLNKHPKIIVQV